MLTFYFPKIKKKYKTMSKQLGVLSTHFKNDAVKQNKIYPRGREKWFSYKY